MAERELWHPDCFFIFSPLFLLFFCFPLEARSWVLLGVRLLGVDDFGWTCFKQWHRARRFLDGPRLSIVDTKGNK